VIPRVQGDAAKRSAVRPVSRHVDLQARESSSSRRATLESGADELPYCPDTTVAETP